MEVYVVFTKVQILLFDTFQCLKNHIDIRYTGEDYGNNKSKDRVMPAQIPELAKQNFPLCMKSMQEVLKISTFDPTIYFHLLHP